MAEYTITKEDVLSGGGGYRHLCQLLAPIIESSQDGDTVSVPDSVSDLLHAGLVRRDFSTISTPAGKGYLGIDVIVQNYESTPC